MQIGTIGLHAGAPGRRCFAANKMVFSDAEAYPNRNAQTSGHKRLGWLTLQRSESAVKGLPRALANSETLDAQKSERAASAKAAPKSHPSRNSNDSATAAIDFQEWPDSADHILQLADAGILPDLEDYA